MMAAGPDAKGEDEEDPVSAFKLEALSALHDRKVAALMRSISTLREDVKRLKAESKEHKRSQLIRSLRDKLRDQELVVDVLKESLTENGMSENQVNEMIVIRTLGGPKRFRPKTREELQNELALAQAKLGERRRIAPQAKVEDRGLVAPPQSPPPPPLPRLLRDDDDAGEKPEDLPSAAHLRESARLMKELENSRVRASRFELQLAETERDLDRLSAEKHDAQRALDRAEQKVAGLTDLQHQLEESREARNAAEIASARKDGELEALRLQLHHVKATGAAQTEAFKHDLSVVQDELNKALAKENEMRSAVERERARAAVAVKGEDAAKTIAEKRVAAAERSLRTAVQERERMQKRCDERQREIHTIRENATSSIRRDAATRDAQARRTLNEQKRLVHAERSNAAAADEKTRSAMQRADLLQRRVDALENDLRACTEAKLDEQSQAETERMALMERIAVLEGSVERERGRRDADAATTESLVDRVSKQTSKERARANKLQEMHEVENVRRQRAEASEAGFAASSAIAKKRLSALQEANVALQGQVYQLKSDLARFQETQVMPKADEELCATRNALIAHMRLAVIYSRVHEATSKGVPLGKLEGQRTHKQLKQARIELE